MKNRFIKYLFALLFIVSTAQAMEEVTTRDGQYYIGFVAEEDANLVLITDENGIGHELAKNSIVDRKTVYADIYTKTGGKYYATLVNTNSDYITFKTNNNYEIRIATQDFDSMLVQTTNSNFSNWQTWRNDPKPLGVPKQYKSLGVEIGFPGVINGSITIYDSYKSGFKITAGILPPKVWGCEVSMLFTVINSQSMISNLFISTGLHSDKNRDSNGKVYWYLGGGADINYHDFFAKIGAGVGVNFASSYQIFTPLVSVGYVHRFQL